ncbi:MAG: hypothetical protein LUD81_05715, partial [Clostridiales bacterium]|nr:hypothetical protein [Clostridiales bacterium]
YYNFAEDSVTGAVNLNDGTVPIYSEEAGYGFVSTTSSMPERTVSTDNIKWTSEGFMITEDGSGSYLHNTNSSNYNYGGLVFRADVPTGSYRLTVELSNGSTSSDTTVVPTGNAGFQNSFRLILGQRQKGAYSALCQMDRHHNMDI